MPRPRATCAVAGTDNANSGPRMISAPSSSACCVPWLALCGLPPSSLIRSWILGFWNSASAISAAFFIDCAATPALPAPDSGRINPTLTWPVPATSGCCAGPVGPGCELNGLENELRLCCRPEQAPSRGAPRIRPTAVRRVVPEGRDLGRLSLGFRGPTIASLLLTDRNRPGLQTSERPGGWIQAYCRRIVNQNKRIKALRGRRRLQGPVSSPLCGAVCQSPQDCGVSALLLLDWHYARKSNFHKHKRRHDGTLGAHIFRGPPYPDRPEGGSGPSSGGHADRQSRRHHLAGPGNAGRRRHHRLRRYPH